MHGNGATELQLYIKISVFALRLLLRLPVQLKKLLDENKSSSVPSCLLNQTIPHFYVFLCCILLQYQPLPKLRCISFNSSLLLRSLLPFPTPTATPSVRSLAPANHGRFINTTPAPIAPTPAQRRRLHRWSLTLRIPISTLQSPRPAI